MAVWAGENGRCPLHREHRPGASRPSKREGTSASLPRDQWMGLAIARIRANSDRGPMNLLAEVEVRSHLDSVLSERVRAGGDRRGGARVALRDLQLEEVVGPGSFDDSGYGDWIPFVLDQCFVRLVPLGWERRRQEAGAGPLAAREVSLFVRRIAFEWGSLLVLDEPSSARNLIVNAPPSDWWRGLPPYHGGAVLSLGFIGGSISALSVTITHCDTTDGCASNLPGCNCSEVEVTTDEGDDAWVCLCERHGSP